MRYGIGNGHERLWRFWYRRNFFLCLHTSSWCSILLWITKVLSINYFWCWYYKKRLLSVWTMFDSVERQVGVSSRWSWKPDIKTGFTCFRFVRSVCIVDGCISKIGIWDRLKMCSYKEKSVVVSCTKAEATIHVTKNVSFCFRQFAWKRLARNTRNKHFLQQHSTGKTHAMVDVLKVDMVLLLGTDTGYCMIYKDVLDVQHFNLVRSSERNVVISSRYLTCDAPPFLEHETVLDQVYMADVRTFSV